MKRVILTAFFCVATQMVSYGQQINSVRIDSLISHIEKYNQGAGQISIFQSGTEIYRRAFELPNKTPQQTKYRIGSITKLFTATLIHQLLEKGELTPETTLDTFFADIPNANKITIGHLLSHTSGLGDYIFTGDDMFWATKPLKEGDILSEIKAQGVHFQPGEGVKYSNSGFYLLAKILEKVYKKEYPMIIQKQILQPLGMNRTLSGVIDDETIFPSYHLNTQNEWDATQEFYFPNVNGVGDLATTPQQMNTFIQALFAGRIISEQSLEKMLPTGKKTYSLGIMQLSFGNNKLYGHSGATYGTRSVLFYDPQTKISLAMSLNAVAAPFNDVFLGVVNGLYDQPNTLTDYSTYQNYKADTNDFNLFEGVYTSTTEPAQKIKIYKKGDDLMVDAAGELPDYMEAFSKNTFLISAKKAFIEFQPDKQKLTLTQNGKSVEFSKIK